MLDRIKMVKLKMDESLEQLCELCTTVSFPFSVGRWLAPASGFPLSSVAFVLIQYLSPRHSVAVWELH